MAWERAATLTFLCDGNMKAARHFLKEHSKLRSKESKEMERHLATWWAARDADAEHTPEHDGFLRCPRVLEQAAKYLDEHELYAWVEQQNLTKGIAPHSAIVHSVALPHRTRFPGEPGVPVVQLRRSRIQWLRRWRQRWRIRLGRIAARQCLPDSVAQQKAARLWNPSPPL